MAHQLIFVNAEDLEEIESLLEPYYDKEFDYWGTANWGHLLTHHWDSPDQKSNKEYRTAAWFLEARKKIDKTWKVWLYLAERILGRQVDPNGIGVTSDEFEKLSRETERRCQNSRGFLLEQGVNLVGSLNNKIWAKDTDYVICKPSFFEGSVFMGTGDCWSEVENEDDIYERIKVLPSESKIWLIDIHI